MLKKTSTLILIVALITVVILAGCSSGDSDKGESGGKIGMTVLNLSNPFFVALTNAAKEEAKSLGYELIINDPKDDANAQVTAIENFVSQKVAAIIVTATDQKVIDEELKKAKEAGIPVIAHTTKLTNAVSWVGSSERNMGLALGRQAGEWIKSVHNGQGEVAVLNFDQIEQVKQRKQGIIDGIHEFSPDVKIVGDQQAGDPTTGLKVAEGFIQANPNLIGIFGINDGGALGAYNAAKAAGKDAAKFAVGGIDAVPEATAAIKEGGIYKYSVDQQPNLTGKTLVQIADKAIHKETFQEENDIEVKAVNADNIKNY
ncbi:MAG: sugar ABC transporter substrate-binding protein [Paenibacillaceae bacterium]